MGSGLSNFFFISKLTRFSMLKDTLEAIIGAKISF
jgi:hypothetical protein